MSFRSRAGFLACGEPGSLATSNTASVQTRRAADGRAAPARAEEILEVLCDVTETVPGLGQKRSKQRGEGSEEHSYMHP